MKYWSVIIAGMVNTNNNMSKQELAVIKDAQVGMRDLNEPLMWFDVELLDGEILLVFDWEKAKQILVEAQVYAVYNLKGQSIVIERTPGGIVNFVKFR